MSGVKAAFLLLIFLLSSATAFGQNQSGSKGLAGPTNPFPSASRRPDDVPAAAALPKLESMASESLAIKQEAKTFLEKWEQDTKNPHASSTVLGRFVEGSSAYFFSHLVEHGTPQEWIDYAQDVTKIPSINSNMPKSYLTQFNDSNPVRGMGDGMFEAMLGNAYASNGKSIWQGEGTLGTYRMVSFAAFYDYHRFALQYAIQFVKENGFAPKKALEQMEKGFIKWKKEEPRLRSLISQYVPLDFQMAKSEGAEILDRDMLQSINARINIGGDGCFDRLPHEAVWDKEGYPINPPDPAVISKVLPECQPIAAQMWQTLHEISPIYAEIVFLGHQRFFRMFGETTLEMKKVPGAGANEIP